MASFSQTGRTRFLRNEETCVDKSDSGSERMKHATETVESLEDEETYLMAERLSNFLLCKRETNLNLAGNKEHSRKQDEDAASSNWKKEHEGRDEHQPTKGQDADSLSVEMSSGATPYRPKTNFERHMVEQMQTLVNHHSTYTSRLKKMDEEIAALQKIIGNQNLGDERVATDDEVEEEDDGDDGSKEKEREQEETNLCLMGKSTIFESIVSSDESECSENRYYQLLDAFQELYDEAMKLQHLIIKFRKENKSLENRSEVLDNENESLKSKLESLENISQNTMHVNKKCDQECEIYPRQLERIKYLMKTLSKFTLESSNLDALLGS
ncbi:hypothetical protein V8G54_002196 [Vigna mungo]|uniref:Uncharacterized protein n=1 Tax=Vigna mungo TaxID=3915 RepID=A0AAQ3P9Y4_VIGMU